MSYVSGWTTWKRLRAVRGNYILQLEALAAHPPTGVRVVTIAHDAWCAQWQGRPCNCMPELSVGPDLTRGDS
jgi:hypothetical protein